jgi:hypothetical protein
MLLGVSCQSYTDPVEEKTDAGGTARRCKAMYHVMTEAKIYIDPIHV